MAREHVGPQMSAGTNCGGGPESGAALHPKDVFVGAGRAPGGAGVATGAGVIAAAGAGAGADIDQLRSSEWCMC